MAGKQPGGPRYGGLARLERVVFHAGHRVPIVEAGPLEGLVVGLESQRVNQVQSASGGGGRATDVPGVLRDLGFDEDDLEGRRGLDAGVGHARTLPYRHDDGHPSRVPPGDDASRRRDAVDLLRPGRRVRGAHESGDGIVGRMAGRGRGVGRQARRRGAGLRRRAGRTARAAAATSPASDRGGASARGERSHQVGELHRLFRGLDDDPYLDAGDWSPRPIRRTP